MAKSNKGLNVAMVTMVTIGLDLADDKSDWVGLDGSGAIVARDRVKTTEPDLRMLFGSIASTTIALEVGTHSRWVSRLLGALGHEVIVANSRRVALISGNKRKNNSIDAELLARLARADRKLLFPIKHRDENSQSDLAVLRSRDILVASRTKLINHVRGVCKGFGTKLSTCSAEAFVAKNSDKVPTVLRRAVDAILEQIQQLTTQIKVFDREITAMIKRHPDVAKVMQIAGVGPITALAFVLTIEDSRRIVRSRSAGAYFGLVPGSEDSGETHEPKRITKEGDKFCRRLLVSAAQYIIGRYGGDSDLRRHGLAIAARGGKSAKKRAVVAVARKLAVVMHRLWVTGDAYIPLYNAQTQPSAA